MLIRFSPGTTAPWSLAYAVVNHADEPLGYVVRCKKGERLPRLPKLGQPHWYLPMMGSVAARPRGEPIPVLLAEAA